MSESYKISKVGLYSVTFTVDAGFVNEPHEWRLSSANKYSPIRVLRF